MKANTVRNISCVREIAGRAITIHRICFHRAGAEIHYSEWTDGIARSINVPQSERERIVDVAVGRESFNSGIVFDPAHFD